MTSRRLGLLQTLLVALAVASASDVPSAEAEADAARRLFEEALAAAITEAPEDVLARLEASFEAGYPTPFDVMQLTAFRPLRHDPEVRKRLRDLLGSHARESRVTIVTPEQPGERMRIEGRVVDAASGAPVAGALAYVFHTTAEGLYAPESPQGGRLAGNPYLFAWVRADEDGRFEIATVVPESYAGFARRNLRHVHFTAEAPGFGAVNRQLYLDRDPEPTDEQRRRAAERGWPILTAEPLPEGGTRLRLTIELRAVSSTAATR